MRNLLMAALLVTAVVGPAAADDVPVTGSWTQLRLSTPVGASPDLQSQDGPALPVENGPTGVIAFSAVRWTKPADLTLARVDTTGPATTPVVWACPATTWPAGDRQPWSERPDIDCSRHVVGSVSGEKITWRTRDLGDAVDVLLVPAPDDTSFFRIAFGAPTADSFTVASTPAPARMGGPTTRMTRGPSVATRAPAPTTGEVRPDPSPPAAAVRPQVDPELTQSPVPHATPVEQGSHAAWPGQLLLAFLSLLLVARAAFPSRPSGTPSSLVRS